MDEEKTPLDYKPQTFYQDWLDNLNEGGKDVTVVDFWGFEDGDENDGDGDGGQLITLD